MEKQLESPGIIDNGCKWVIERYPVIQSGYVSATIKQLEKTPGAKVYTDSQIKRVINDQIALNLNNLVIKTAFFAAVGQLYPEVLIDSEPTVNA